MRRLGSVLMTLLLLAVLLGIWELYVDLGGANSLVLPAPHAIATSLYQDRSLLWSNLLVTMEEVVLGLLAGMIIAFALSILIHFSRTLRRAVYPLLVASQTVPIPIIAPVLILWLGFGLGPKVLIVALIAFFPVIVTTSTALEGVDGELLKLMRTFDASRYRTFREVELPSALPGLFTGVRIAAVFVWIGAIFAEWSGASAGLGYLFNVSMAQLLVARACACVVLLSVGAIALFAGLGLLQRILLPWAQRPAEFGAR